jgi:hypothetical protein
MLFRTRRAAEEFLSGYGIRVAFLRRGCTESVPQTSTETSYDTVIPAVSKVEIRDPSHVSLILVFSPARGSFHEFGMTLIAKKRAYGGPRESRSMPVCCCREAPAADGMDYCVKESGHRGPSVPLWPQLGPANQKTKTAPVTGAITP